MCTYNGEKYLRQQLDSILAQTYPIREIIIQDDHSTDGTMDILLEYAAKYPVIKVLVHEQHTTVNENFFSAFGKATSEYIAIADQDDIWMTDKIARQMETIGDKWCCFHLTQHFVGTPPVSPMIDKRELNYGLERTVFLGVVPGHTMLIHKKLYDLYRQHVSKEKAEAAGYSFCYDTIMVMIADAYNMMTYLPAVLVYHRVHPTSFSTTLGRKDLSQRTVTNAIQMVWRNLSPTRRKEIKPLIKQRMLNMRLILDCFPSAPYTDNVREIIDCYTDENWLARSRFVWILIKNRNKIFYAPEHKQWVAVLRAVTFPVTMYDYFEVSYKHWKERQTPIHSEN